MFNGQITLILILKFYYFSQGLKLVRKLVKLKTNKLYFKT